MSEHVYEVEVKSLLGGLEASEHLLQKMKEQDPTSHEIDSNSQLNHYFIGGDLKQLVNELLDQVPQVDLDKIKNLAEKAAEYSVRTRDKDGVVLIVIKASVDDTNSSNGTARIEIESKVNMTIDQLDQILLNSGFKYQAKWSRQRREYKFKDMNVCIDKNAGYGYLAEFEKMIENKDLIEETKKQIRQVIQSLGFEELDQARLDRMFQYYNQNWKDYYGTDKVFNIE
ncbi:MAG: hypothetical protein OHK0017_02850 [Patescibacteria group bacterium]